MQKRSKYTPVQPWQINIPTHKQLIPPNKLNFTLSSAKTYSGGNLFLQPCVRPINYILFGLDTRNTMIIEFSLSFVENKINTGNKMLKKCFQCVSLRHV